MSSKTASRSKAIELLRQEISYFQEQVGARKKALAILLQADASAGEYAGVRPIVAARKLLQTRGGSMSLAELNAALLAGGITTGKKRADHNVRLSIEKCVSLGTLELKDGIVSLPTHGNDR